MRLLIFLLLSWTTFQSTAQRIADFQLDDNHAIQIDDEILDLLTAQQWYLSAYEYRGREGSEHSKISLGRTTIKFERDGQLQLREENRKWAVHPEQKLLEISSLQEIAERKGLLGGYAIWKISDSSLTLAKVLTSTHDQILIYHFVNTAVVKEQLAIEQAARKKHYEQKMKEGNGVVELMIDGETMKVRPMSTQDLFMRNIDTEPGYHYYLDENGKIHKTSIKN